MAEPVELGISQFKKELKREEIDPNILKVLEVATWLPSGDKQAIVLPESKYGLDGADLQRIGANPFSLNLTRSEDGAFCKLSVSERSGASEDNPLLEVTYDVRNHKFFGESSTDLDVLLDKSAPLFEKLGVAQMDLARDLTLGQKNRLLRRAFFNTSSENLFWLQLSSVIGEGISNEREPLYRLYLNSTFQDTKEYSTKVQPLINACRTYEGSPLSFKMAYAGSDLEGLMGDEQETKVVFYFKGKDEAVQFGDWLADKEFMQDFSVGANKRAFLPQQEWGAGLLLLGKGTKEDRATILDSYRRASNTAMKESYRQLAIEHEMEID